MTICLPPPLLPLRRWKWVSGSWVTGHCDWPMTHDDEITVQWLAKIANHCNFLFLVDIKKLRTHSITPIIIAGGLTLTYDFLLLRPRGLSSTTMPRPLLVPCVGVMTMGHGSWSRTMTHFHLCFGPHCIYGVSQKVCWHFPPNVWEF